MLYNYKKGYNIMKDSFSLGICCALSVMGYLENSKIVTLVFALVSVALFIRFIYVHRKDFLV